MDCLNLKIDLNGLQSLIEAKPMLIKFYQILVENIIRIMKSKGLLIFNATPKLLKELNVNPKIKCGIREETPYVKISRHYMPKKYCDAIKPQYMDEL